MENKLLYALVFIVVLVFGGIAYIQIEIIPKRQQDARRYNDSIEKLNQERELDAIDARLELKEQIRKQNEEMYRKHSIESQKEYERRKAELEKKQKEIAESRKDWCNISWEGKTRTCKSHNEASEINELKIRYAAYVALIQGHDGKHYKFRFALSSINAEDVDMRRTPPYNLSSDIASLFDVVNIRYSDIANSTTMHYLEQSSKYVSIAMQYRACRTIKEKNDCYDNVQRALDYYTEAMNEAHKEEMALKRQLNSLFQ